MMSAEKAEELGLKPQLRIVAHAVAGVDPSLMGTGPHTFHEKSPCQSWAADRRYGCNRIERSVCFSDDCMYSGA